MQDDNIVSVSPLVYHLAQYSFVRSVGSSLNCVRKKLAVLRLIHILKTKLN